jgi:hypothetical protein
VDDVSHHVRRRFGDAGERLGVRFYRVPNLHACESVPRQ